MSNVRKNTLSTKRMVLASILTALIIVMSFTPLGYLKIGTVEITFLPIPVAVGAIILGPWWGLFFGTVFGVTSFLQCFGMSVFGTALMGVNPVYTFILCLVPRLLVGFLTGLIYKLFCKFDKKRFFAVSVSAVMAAIINTLFFTVLFVIFFCNADLSGNESLPLNFSQMTIMELVLLIVTVNSVVEIIACGAFGAAISKTLAAFVPEFSK